MCDFRQVPLLSKWFLVTLYLSFQYHFHFVFQFPCGNEKEVCVRLFPALSKGFISSSLVHLALELMEEWFIFWVYTIFGEFFFKILMSPIKWANCDDGVRSAPEGIDWPVLPLCQGCDGPTLEKEMATHSGVLAWENLMDRGTWWVYSLWGCRVRHDWASKHTAHDGPSKKWLECRSFESIGFSENKFLFSSLVRFLAQWYVWEDPFFACYNFWLLFKLFGTHWFIWSRNLQCLMYFLDPNVIYL